MLRIRYNRPIQGIRKRNLECVPRSRRGKARGTGSKAGGPGRITDFSVTDKPKPVLRQDHDNPAAEATRRGEKRSTEA